MQIFVINVNKVLFVRMNTFILETLQARAIKFDDNMCAYCAHNTFV